MDKLNIVEKTEINNLKTSNSEVEKENSKYKTSIDKNNLQGFKISFNNSCINSYYILKNKIYLLYITSNKEVVLFNIIKMKKVCIFSNKTIKDIYDNIISHYDNDTCKSWFSLDIKLGYITFKFNSDMFSNQVEYDLNYFEKIKEYTKDFTTNLYNKDNKIKYLMNEINYNSNSQPTCIIVDSDQISKTIQLRCKKLDNQTNYNYNNVGYVLITSILKNCDVSLNSINENKNVYLNDLLDKNFYNTGTFKNLINKKYDSQNKDVKNIKKLLSNPDMLYNKSNLFLFNKNNQANNQNKDIIKIKHNNLKDDNTYSDVELLSLINKNIYFIKTNNSTNTNNNTVINNQYIDINKIDINYMHLTDNLRNTLIESKFYNDKDCIINKNSKINSENNTKFELCVCNKYKDFFKNVELIKTDDNTEDVFEVNNNVTISKFKEWIYGFYINRSEFLKKINQELKNIDKSIVRY